MKIVIEGDGLEFATILGALFYDGKPEQSADVQPDENNQHEGRLVRTRNLTVEDVKKMLPKEPQFIKSTDDFFRLVAMANSDESSAKDDEPPTQRRAICEAFKKMTLARIQRLNQFAERDTRKLDDVRKCVEVIIGNSL